jgi:hypothetical protein
MKALFVLICLSTEHHGQLCRDVPLHYRYATAELCQAGAARDETAWEREMRSVFGADYRVVRSYCGAPPKMVDDG